MRTRVVRVGRRVLAAPQTGLRGLVVAGLRREGIDFTELRVQVQPAPRPDVQGKLPQVQRVKVDAAPLRALAAGMPDGPLRAAIEQNLETLGTDRLAAVNLRVMGRDEASYRDEVMELIEWVGLGERMWALPPVLSGGEKQRAAIARAVIARPQLLLADEPTGNVDPSLAQRLLRLFIELNKSGTSVVIATHDIALMDQFDARRLVLHDGRLHLYD